MKQLKYCFFAALTLLFAACSKVEAPEMASGSESDVTLQGESVQVKDGMLNFSSQSSLDNVVGKLKENRYSTTRSAEGAYAFATAGDNKVKVDGFRSLYDVYEEAMQEAEHSYGTREDYEKFKTKYSVLYFPEEENDYSAFLPVSDKELAKVLNPQGEIMIDGKVHSMKDITSFQQLKELGWTIPTSENEQSITRAPIVSSTLNSLSEVINRDRDRSMWVNIFTRRSGMQGVWLETVIEVCFRGKGFLGGWYNYSSVTQVTMSINGSIIKDSKSETSSHDYVIHRYMDSNGAIPISGYIDILHQGFMGDVYRVNFRQ